MKRILGELVAIDAWHRSFSGTRDTVDLHVDVVFDEARLGGEPSSDVTFRLSLKRAEIIVRVPETEPLKVIRSSVSRNSPAKTGKRYMNAAVKSTVAAGAAVSAGVQQGNVPTASGSLRATADKEIVKSDTTEVVEDWVAIRVTQRRTQGGDYVWRVESGVEGPLDGRPWDPIAEPRARLKDTRLGSTRSIEPCVIIEARCLREDIVISDIRLKDDSLWSKAKQVGGHKNRLAVAEGYIRQKLSEQGLEVLDISDRHAPLILATLVAENDDND